MTRNCSVHGEQKHIQVVSDIDNSTLATILGFHTPSGENVSACYKCIDGVEKRSKKKVKRSPPRVAHKEAGEASEPPKK